MKDDHARNKWPSILTAIGIDERILNGHQHPCPICGGKDRFRFDNKEGRGTFYCNKCGAGDGYILIEKFKGFSRGAAIKLAHEAAGVATEVVAPVRSKLSIQKSLQVVWDQSQPMGGPCYGLVVAYLKSRSIPFTGDVSIRCHPALRLTDPHGMERVAPAMVAKVYQNGRAVAIHRTYLLPDGQKVRKMMTPTEKLTQCYIPLGGQPRVLIGGERELGIAEGIETALSAAFKFHLPVWSVIDMGHMAKFNAPDGVQHLRIFGDNDATFSGQYAAYECAYRNHGRGINCRVHIPQPKGWDWNDERQADARADGFRDHGIPAGDNLYP